MARKIRPVAWSAAQLIAMGGSKKLRTFAKKASVEKKVDGISHKS